MFAGETASLEVPDLGVSEEAGREEVSDPASQSSVGAVTTYVRWWRRQQGNHGQLAGQHGGLPAGADLIRDLLLPLLALGSASELAADGLYQGT